MEEILGMTFGKEPSTTYKHRLAPNSTNSDFKYHNDLARACAVPGVWCLLLLPHMRALLVRYRYSGFLVEDAEAWRDCCRRWSYLWGCLSLFQLQRQKSQIGWLQQVPRWVLGTGSPKIKASAPNKASVLGWQVLSSPSASQSPLCMCVAPWRLCVSNFALGRTPVRLDYAPSTASF